MEKEFIPYEQALALKELGFDEPCLANYSIDVIGETVPHFRYNNRISEAFSIDEGVWFNHNLDKEYVWSAPLYQQAFRFFREEHLLSCEITGFYVSSNYGFDVSIVNLTDFLVEFRAGLVENYREAELKCLEKLIEIVGQKNKNYVE